MSVVEQKYQELCVKKSDINEHLPTLKKYASECDHVTEMGVRGIVSTWALLAGNPKKLVSIDIVHPSVHGGNLDEVVKASIGKTFFHFKMEDTRTNEIEETDLLFIDTWHHYEQLKIEFRHAQKVRKYIILHDTTTFGINGESGKEGLKRAVDEFLVENPHWKIKEVFTNNNGLTILERDPKIKFVVPLIDKPYYLWQMLVQMANFRELGYEQDTIYPVIAFGKPSDLLLKLASYPGFKSKVLIYIDDRKHILYPANMKPWLMYKYLSDYPTEDIICYLDSDVVFTRHFDFTPFKNMKHKIYGSDTASYTNVSYIKSKGESLFYELCDLASINPEILVNNSNWEVGAQYLMQGTTPEFWKEIYEMSTHLYKYMVDTQAKYTPEGSYPIQSWCSEMYYTQWAALKYGFEPEIHPSMRFAWADWKAEEWNKVSIFHNAGIVKENGKDMCKITWQDSPFKKEIKVSPESISTYYVDLIRKTEVVFSDIIW